MNAHAPITHTIIPIDRSKPFDLSRWFWDHLRMKRTNSRSAALDRVELLPEVNQLLMPDWELNPQEVPIDCFGFAALWEQREKVLAHFSPWKMAREYEFWQFYCDGTVFENSHGVEYVPFMRIVQIRAHAASAVKGTVPLSDIERTAHWGYSPTGYDWGKRFPRLVARTY